MVEFRTAELGDIRELNQNMRQEDRAEIEAASGNVTRTLVLTYKASTWMMAGVEARGLAFLFGVAPISAIGGIGAPWLLSTNLARDNVRALITHSQRYLPVMLSKYHTLINAVDARNKASIRYLKHLGFQLDQAAPFGVTGQDFHIFKMEAPCAVQ